MSWPFPSPTPSLHVCGDLSNTCIYLCVPVNTGTFVCTFYFTAGDDVFVFFSCHSPGISSNAASYTVYMLHNRTVQPIMWHKEDYYLEFCIRDYNLLFKTKRDRANGRKERRNKVIIWSWKLISLREPPHRKSKASQQTPRPYIHYIITLCSYPTAVKGRFTMRHGSGSCLCHTKE